MSIRAASRAGPYTSPYIRRPDSLEVSPAHSKSDREDIAKGSQPANPFNDLQSGISFAVPEVEDDDGTYLPVSPLRDRF